MVPDKENKCKGPDVESVETFCFLRNSKEANVAAAKKTEGRKVRNEVEDVAWGWMVPGFPVQRECSGLHTN